MFDGMLKEFSDWANEKENKKYITDLVDSIADRQMARLTGSLGGTIKAMNNQPLDGKQMIMQFLGGLLMNKQQGINSSHANVLTENPYGKTQ